MVLASGELNAADSLFYSLFCAVCYPNGHEIFQVGCEFSASPGLHASSSLSSLMLFVRLFDEMFDTKMEREVLDAMLGLRGLCLFDDSSDELRYTPGRKLLNDESGLVVTFQDKLAELKRRRGK